VASRTRDLICRVRLAGTGPVLVLSWLTLTNIRRTTAKSGEVISCITSLASAAYGMHVTLTLDSVGHRPRLFKVNTGKNQRF
jgi:hypothetical protein